MLTEVKHWHVTYNDMHNLIRSVTPEIAQKFNPDLLIAIGGGGFFPARVMRTFLRQETDRKTIQIQAIGLSLYETLPGTTAEQIGNEVIRTQWLGPESGRLLLGKRNLIIDEVDDTRKTLHYALSELQKDVETELLLYPPSEREALRGATKFAIFVVHNKNKPKLASLPSGTPYYAGSEVGDVWLDYPWEAIDIDEHDRLAALDVKSFPPTT
ncbi:PRTase-like protein [Tricholoma matsutake]|nr:PRTase-like protein [Tricholoma matsutake 945]